MKVIFLLLLLLSSSIVFSKDFVIDSLVQQLKTEENDTQKVNSYNELGYQYRQISVSKSIDYIRQALILSDSLNYSKGQIRSYILLGIVYKNSGSFDMAIEYMLKGLKIAEETNNQEQVSVCYNNIGTIYQIQKKYIDAIEYYKKSLAIEEKFNNKRQISIRYYNIGTIYELTDSLDKAYNYYYNSLIIEQELNNKEGIYYALYGIVGLETRKGNYNTAQEKISEALNIAYELNDLAGMARCYNELGKLYRARKEIPEAIQSFEKSILYADSVNYLSDLKEGYLQLSNTYLLSNNFKDAYTFLNKYISLNDSINNIDISNKIAEISAKYELEKKEQEISFLENQQSLEQAKTATEKQNRYFLIVSFILAIALTLSNLGRVLESVKQIIIYSALVISAIFIITFIIYFIKDHSSENIAYLLFSIFVDVLTYAILPIFVFVLVAERILLNKRFKTAQSFSKQIKQFEKPEINEEISLFADNQKTSISMLLNDLLCIEANDNYCNVYYNRNNIVKREMLRITLKSMESQLENHKEVIRCHKSYIVNLYNLEKLTGNAQGYKLDVKMLDFKVPVSRNFPKEMIEKFKK